MNNLNIKKFPDGFNILPNNSDGEYLIISRKGDKKPFKISVENLSSLLGVAAGDIQRIQAVDAGPLPTPDAPNRYMVVTGVGDYTFGGSTIGTNADGYQTTFWFNGVTWVNNGSVRVKGDMPTGTTVLNPNGNNIPTEKATADYVEIQVSNVDNKISQVTRESSDPTIMPIEITLVAGQYHPESGVLNPSVNWISTDIRDIPNGTTKIKIESFGTGNATVKSNRFYYFNDSTYLGLKGSGEATGSYTDTIISGANKVAIQIDAGAGVGADLPNSPYQNSFKIYAINDSADNLVIDTNKIIDRIESEQLLSIESELQNIDQSNKFYDGVGYPSIELGQVSDKYIDTNTQRLYIKNSNDWGDGMYFGDEVDFEYPNDFTFRPFDITIQGNNFAIPKIKSLFEEFVQADYNRLTKYYIDPILGNNANDGLTPSTALKTLSTAITTKGARNIELLPTNGMYPRTENLTALTDVASSEPLIIRAKEKVYMACSDKATMYTWTLVGGNVYSAPRTGVNNVIDTSRRDSKGDFEILTKVNSLAECQSTVNSWYTNGTLVYIHNSVSSAPSFNIELVLTSRNVYYPSENVPYVYFENIDFYNSNSNEAILIQNNSVSQYNTKVYLSNVGGIKNILGNGIAVNNIKETWLENCRGFGNLRDGLNYHTTLLANGYQPMKIVELGCTGGDSGLGQTAETSSNASTTHEGNTIIRLNCDYNNTHGATVADVNAGCLSLNINVTANECVYEPEASFRINGEGSKMWLYGCYGKSSNALVKSIIANTGSVAYKDSKTKIPNGTTGSIVDI